MRKQMRKQPKIIKVWWYRCSCSKDLKLGFPYKTEKEARQMACKDAEIYQVIIKPVK